MDTRIIKLTESAFKYGNLNLRCCGRDFFPPDVFGGPNKKSGLGNPITLNVEGFDKEIKTDIPTDAKTGKPRWIFRERGWVKEFIRSHKLVQGNIMAITQLDKRTYRVTSNNGCSEIVEKRNITIVPECKEGEAVLAINASSFKKPIRAQRDNMLKKCLNSIICTDCVEGMKQLPPNCIDMVVTSPPYDGIRKYKGFIYDLHATGKEIFRILKDGGIAAMVIQDQTIDFAKTLTSFRTIVDWCDNIGFRLFETVIYRKYGSEGAWWKSRFRIDHEYMPIFMKGARPQYFNKEPLKVKSKHGGKVMTGSGSRRTDGRTNKTVTRKINESKCRGTVWDYLMAGDKDPLKRKHPAPFPDKIPYDFIQCFCPPNGIVLDPFMGSGTTAVAAKTLKRNYIGFEICPEYCKLAEKRIRQTTPPLFA
jgi:site-specific DNA-methyltransferase (adenine-specific)